MKEYEDDDKFKWIDSKKVDTDNISWRTIIIPVEIEFSLLKQNQLHFGQLEHEFTPFTTESTEQKFKRNASTDETEKVLEDAYKDDKDAELTEIMKLVPNNCVQIIPPEKTSTEIIVQQLRGKM